VASSGSVRGGVIASRLEFVRSERGDNAVQRILSRLSDADRALFGGTINADGWYPFPAGERLDALIAEEYGGGEAIFRTMGIRSAEHNLGATQRLFVEGRDPHGLLRSASTIYRLYYDTGSRTYQAVSMRRAVLRTLQSRTFSRFDCLTVMGWHEKAIEMCGGREPRVTHPKCRAKGDAWCEYVCEWG
jgi:uncharacterized protein (TIGR02265 family)